MEIVPRRIGSCAEPVVLLEGTRKVPEIHADTLSTEQEDLLAKMTLTASPDKKGII